MTPSANIDPHKVAVTGCSRYGKGALAAGAFDDRIALTIPQESGSGGTSSYRVAQDQYDPGAQSGLGHVQTSSSAAGDASGSWFRNGFGSNFGNAVTKLPYDHHAIIGLVAPRPLLVIDNEIDWLGIDPTYTAGSIGKKIWDALGVPDNMGYWQSAPHGHCQMPSSQQPAIEAFVKKFLLDDPNGGDTDILRADGSAQADLASWMDWDVPTLQ